MLGKSTFAESERQRTPSLVVPARFIRLTGPAADDSFAFLAVARAIFHASREYYACRNFTARASRRPQVACRFILVLIDSAARRAARIYSRDALLYSARRGVERMEDALARCQISLSPGRRAR